MGKNNKKDSKSNSQSNKSNKFVSLYLNANFDRLKPAQKSIIANHIKANDEKEKFNDPKEMFKVSVIGRIYDNLNEVNSNIESLYKARKHLSENLKDIEERDADQVIEECSKLPGFTESYERFQKSHANVMRVKAHMEDTGEDFDTALKNVESMLINEESENEK